MSAVERLAAALAKDCEAESVGGVGLVRRHDDHPTRCLRDHAGFADRLLAADPTLAADIAAGEVMNRRGPSSNVPGCECDRDNEDMDEPFQFCAMHERQLRPLQWETLALLVIDYQAVLTEATAAADKCREAIEAQR